MHLYILYEEHSISEQIHILVVSFHICDTKS